MSAKTRRQREISDKICLCKEDKEDEMIIRNGPNKSGCPGKGAYHKSCIQVEEIINNYVCFSCREISSQRSDNTEICEDEFIGNQYAAVDEQPNGEVEIEQLPSYKKKVEKILSHHYINRDYKNGERIRKKLFFKLKWSGFNITEHEKGENMLHPGVDAKRALTKYCQKLPQRTMKTLLGRHPEYLKFFAE